MKKTIISLFLLAIGMLAKAVVASPNPIFVESANGDTMTILRHGDARFHWTTDLYGNWIEQQANGTYKQVEPLTEEQISDQRALSVRRAPASVQKACPLNLAPRGLVILVGFSDKPFSNTYAEYKDMLDGDNYTRNYTYKGYYGVSTRVKSEGSAKRYFSDQSDGKYQPIFDLAGPYTLKNTYSYYGSNNSWGEDSHADEMIIEACQAADADGIDFTLYDNNNDGEIDFVYVIYAGYGEADSPDSKTVWPHTYWIKDGYGKNVRLDGKYLNTYACGNEINYTSQQHGGIGTFCHEFTHVLGLPDFYATNNATHKDLGSWDLLCSGSYNNDGNTPPAYSAYERFFVGWLKPDVLASPRSVELADIKSGHQAYMVTETGQSNFKGNDPNPTEFYILENRQKTGWDAYLPGHGLLITHVRYSYNNWQNNIVNNNAKSMGVDLIEADGKAPSGNDGKAGDAFPNGADEYSMFNDAYPITHIVEDDGIIRFDFMGGADWISTLALEEANKDSKIVYKEVVGVYDMAGHLIRQRVSGEDFNLNDLAPGLYILRTSTGQDNPKYKGIKIFIK